MGLQRIIIDIYTAEERAYQLARDAAQLIRNQHVTVNELQVISHPGEADERKVNL
jgi:tRNA U55 pseudouridine synthase TruB